MKQSIASVWLLGIIIIFILIFACYISVTVSYTASFKLKNEVVNIIEKHHGINDLPEGTSPATATSSNFHGTSYSKVQGLGGFQTINLYLRGNAYTAMGQCPKDGNTWYGVKELVYQENASSASVEKAKDNTKYYYCFSKYGTGKVSRYTTAYYKVRLFYKFEFPVLSEFLSVKVEGMTDEIYNPFNDGYVINGDNFSKTTQRTP